MDQNRSNTMNKVLIGRSCKRAVQMMTTCKRDLRYRILKCISRKVVVALFFLQFLPYVICQDQDRGNSHSRVKFTSESLILVSLLMIFLLSMLAGCLFYVVPGRETETGEGIEVQQSREKSGLHKDVIESFTSFFYSEVKELKIGECGVECAICLSEFEDEEMLRMISPCSHVFHANCVDVWLSSWSTCPVCRLDLSPSSEESPPCNDHCN